LIAFGVELLDDKFDSLLGLAPLPFSARPPATPEASERDKKVSGESGEHCLSPDAETILWTAAILYPRSQATN
jgi:hypothetical protein